MKIGTPKTFAGNRDVYMSPFLKSELKKSIKTSNIVPFQKEDIKNDLLFIHPNGKLVAPATVNSQFRRLCKDANVMTYTDEIHRRGKIINLKSSTAHVHMIRHTYITRCREAGVDVKAVQVMAGHKRIKTTLDVYTSVTDEFKKIETDKLSEYYDKQQLR